MSDIETSEDNNPLEGVEDVEIQEEMDIWQIMTKWGNEHTLPLYDKTKNPGGVYLCTNEMKIGEVFTIPCQIFT